jgi:hypothetical protein
LIGIVKNRLAEGQVVPLHARHFASLAPDARRGVNEFAGRKSALRVFSGHASGVSGHFLDA